MAIVFGIGRLYAAVQLRNCSSPLLRRYSSQLSSLRRLHAAMVTTVTTSRSYYHKNHNPMSLYSPGMASRAFSSTPKATDEIAGETLIKCVNKKNDMAIDDDYSDSGQQRYVDEKKWNEVFLKALEREGVTDMMLDYRCWDVIYGLDLDNHFKSVQFHRLFSNVSVLYLAAGFAAADKGVKGRPGVCVTSANSGILAYDALVKCRRLGENLPVVCVIASRIEGFEDRILFNDEPLMSLPHYYRILDVRDITTIVQQAFSSAYNEGGPVFIDIQHLIVDYDDTNKEGLDAEEIVRYLNNEKSPLCAVYVSSSWDGDGVGNANGSELSRFAKLTGIPVTRSLVGLAELASVVLYLGATANDLPDITALDEAAVLVFPVDVSDDKMAKIIKYPTHIPTLKELNEMLVQREGIYDSEFFELQRKLEDTLTSCYADTFTTELEANNNRITREVAIQVLDEFFEANKDDIIVLKDCDSWICGYGASYTADKHVFVVLDGVDKAVRLGSDWPYPRQIILDNTGWTKRFYHETRKVSPLITKYKWRGEVVMNKSDLEDALYDMLNEETNSIHGFLVVAVVPPDHREIIPNFSRDNRFVAYPVTYVCDLNDQDE